MLINVGNRIMVSQPCYLMVCFIPSRVSAQGYKIGPVCVCVRRSAFSWLNHLSYGPKIRHGHCSSNDSSSVETSYSQVLTWVCIAKLWNRRLLDLKLQTLGYRFRLKCCHYYSLPLIISRMSLKVTGQRSRLQSWKTLFSAVLWCDLCRLHRAILLLHMTSCDNISWRHDVT